MSSTGIPKGTRDFTPAEMRRRNFIFQTIKEVFELHGFEPVETPAMERTETLTGKYGEEGDRLIFKIMPRGAKLSKAENKIKENREFSINSASEEALRYDLTVPFARFVVKHQNELYFPFKRYQIQPVWRADRPQKGRYREFYQCDADVIGTDSLWSEIDLTVIMNSVFNKLKLPDVLIKVNNRKILSGLAEVLGESEKLTEITTALDKLDKMPREKVSEELIENGVSEKAVRSLQPLMELDDDNQGRLIVISELMRNSETGTKGVEELSFLLNTCLEQGITNLKFEPTLARGLNYYTGTIFEVVHPDFPSSITGGGRYDDLTGMFGLSGMSGVGISFGADRIYDLMLSKNLFPAEITSGTDVLFINFGEKEAAECFKWIIELRQVSVRAELYPDAAKMKKQMKYADSRNVKYTAVLGEAELEKGTVQLKNMKSGEQEEITLQQLTTKLKP